MRSNWIVCQFEDSIKVISICHCCLSNIKVFDSKNGQEGIVSAIEEMLPLKPFDRQKTLLAKDITDNGFGRLKEKLACDIKF